MPNNDDGMEDAAAIEQEMPPQPEVTRGTKELFAEPAATFE